MTSHISNLNPLSDIFAACRAVHPAMTMAQLQVFLFFVIHPGITFREVGNRTGLKEGSVSRNLAILGQHGNRTTEALGLLFNEVDDSDRRLRIPILAPKGSNSSTSYRT